MILKENLYYRKKLVSFFSMTITYFLGVIEVSFEERKLHEDCKSLINNLILCCHTRRIIVKRSSMVVQKRNTMIVHETVRE